MQSYDPSQVEGTDLEPRTIRALTQFLTVMPEGGNIYTVVSVSGNSYTVDIREGRCTCPDAQYNLQDNERCKHERRVRFATGKRTIPAWVDRDAVDPQLGEHTDSAPRVAATDGGTDKDDAIDAEIVNNDRPDDCKCHTFNGDPDLPCFPCWKAGFNDPATVE